MPISDPDLSGLPVFNLLQLVLNVEVFKSAIPTSRDRKSATPSVTSLSLTTFAKLRGHCFMNEITSGIAVRLRKIRRPVCLISIHLVQACLNFRVASSKCSDQIAPAHC